MERLVRLAKLAAAWLSAYVAVGGLAGFALARSRAPFRIFNDGVLPARCWPELGLFDMIQTRCVCGIWDVAWFVAVGAPRLVIGVVGMAVTLAADAVRRPAGFGAWCALAGLVVMSAGVMFGYFVGVSFWRRRLVLVAMLVGLGLAISHVMYVVDAWL